MDQPKKFFGTNILIKADSTLKKLRPTERAILVILAVILAISAFSLLLKVNDFFLTEVPEHGGELTEGIVGFPRFINPLFAISDADRDLTALVYSGLLKYDPSGTLVPDLAKSYSISEDGLKYTFILKDDIYFQDGTPITTDDVEFTILKAEDNNLKSPKRASWNGVTVEKISPTEITFTLRQAYSPFLENTTLGILPKHLWKDVDPDQFTFSQYNVEPIGSGPYQIDGIKRDSGGLPVYYKLKAFKNYSLGEPYISTLNLRFYANEQKVLEAYKNHEVESVTSISPQDAKVLEQAGDRIGRTPLPRVFALFFNQNQAPVFANKEVRVALDTVVDKQAIVNDILSGYATTISGPIPPGLMPQTNPVTFATSTEAAIGEARNILERNGWKLGDDGIYTKTVKKDTQRLAFSISTANIPELKAVAERLQSIWHRLGAEVDVKIFESGDLNQNIIRPRKYGALLFGEIIGRDLDLFAFWHSSQRNDPGLNIALYANIKADKLLSEARTLQSLDDRINRYQQFETEVAKDVPAIFLYSPDLIYVLPDKIKGLKLGAINTPAERFLNIQDWYTDTQKVWNLDYFTKEKIINN